MTYRTLMTLLLAGLPALLGGPALGQRAGWGGPAPVQVPAPGPGSALLTAQANAATVGVVSGAVQGTYVRIAADLANVLDDGTRLRVLPIIGRGSVQNVADLLYLRGVDIGIVQADVLSFIQRERMFPGVQQSIQYITKLYDEEVHILARSDINALADLAGKPVNVDGLGSGTAMTASVVFDTVGVKPKLMHETQATALQKLQQGEIAALVYVTGKPANLFTALPPGSGLHFLPIPMTENLLDTYLPARLEHAQYANLVADGTTVETLGVGAVMAVYAWPRGTQRYEKVRKFVNALFANIGRLKEPPNHPKWADVTLSAQLPGWVRFAAADEALRQVAESHRP